MSVKVNSRTECEQETDMTASAIAELVLDAAKSHDVTTLTHYLKRGTSPNIRDSRGNSLLMLCIADQACVNLLLEFDADVNAQNDVGRTALHSACVQGPVATVQRLLEKGAEQVKQIYGITPLNCTQGRHYRGLVDREGLLIAKLLVSCGADINQGNCACRTPVAFYFNLHEELEPRDKCEALYIESMEMMFAAEVQYYRQERCFFSIFHKSCYRGTIRLTKMMYMWGVDIHMRGWIRTCDKEWISRLDIIPPIEAAILGGDPRTCHFLISVGADESSVVSSGYIYRDHEIVEAPPSSVRDGRKRSPKSLKSLSRIAILVRLPPRKDQSANALQLPIPVKQYICEPMLGESPTTQSIWERK